MKFKNYLTEYTEHSISKLIADGCLPLEEGMMRRLGYSENDIMVYHLTNNVFLDDMIKNQNKKKHISTFSIGGPELARLPSQPNTLLLLQGTSVLSGNVDIWSKVSIKGIRWLDIKGRASKLYFLIEGILYRLSTKYNINAEDYNDINNLDINTQKYFYRDYLKLVENMLNNGGYKELKIYLESASKMSYNEIILTKWTIKKIWSVGIENETVKDLCSKYGIKYDGKISSREFKNLRI